MNIILLFLIILSLASLMAMVFVMLGPFHFAGKKNPFRKRVVIREYKSVFQGRRFGKTYQAAQYIKALKAQGYQTISARHGAGRINNKKHSNRLV